MKNIVIIHGWGSSSKGDWVPWLAGECRKLGYNVIAPDMPDTDAPDIDKWVDYLKNILKSVDENTYFVGHSIGCQTIMRFLEGQDKKGLLTDTTNVGHPNLKVGGVVFVAGWFTLINLENEEAEQIAKPWLETPIDFEKVKNVLPKSVIILSDNDPFVPLAENKKIFEEKLDSRVVVVHNAGHITSDDGFTEIPEVLNQLKKIIGK
jgi:hypothetical protein